MEGGWQLVDCLELIDLDLPMVVQLVERKSVSYSQPIHHLEPAGWEKLIGSAVTGLLWLVELVWVRYLELAGVLK